jgi:hypothetical protein
MLVHCDFLQQRAAAITPKPDELLARIIAKVCTMLIGEEANMLRVLNRGAAVRSLLIIACLFMSAVLVFGEDEAQLLALARAGYRSAQEVIQTLSCNMEMEAGFPQSVMRKQGKYWRSSRHARVHDEQPHGTEDFYWGPTGEVHSVWQARGSKGGQVAATRCSMMEVAQPLDAWRYMLLELDLYLEHTKRTPHAKRERIAGRDCIALTLPFPFAETEESAVTFWLDVGRNYLPWKRKTVSKDYQDEYEIVEYAEHRPGIFFPVKCAGRSYKGSKQVGACSFVLSQLRINEPIAKEVFQLPTLPWGTQLTDNLKKQTYPVDGNWQQLAGSRVEPYEKTALPSPASGQVGSQSTASATSWTLWIAPASIAVLLTAGAAWLYQRYRNNALKPG